MEDSSLTSALITGLSSGSVGTVLGYVLANRKINLANRQVALDEQKAVDTAQQWLQDSALELIKPYRDEVKSLRGELADERTKRRKLEQDNAELRSALNILAQERVSDRARIKRLEERLDTGELTPPPHDVPPNEPA